MGSQITITGTDGFQFSAYQAGPEGPARGAVVVIQEIFGVNSHVRAVADRYAAAGYLAVAPAIFDRIQPDIQLGYTDEDVQTGFGYAFGQLDFATALADVGATGRYAGQAGKVGIVGYCFGGLMTANAAIHHGEVFSAAASYYGGGTPGLVDQTPVVPMMMHFGAKDHFIPLEGVDGLRNAWPQVEIHVYEADHGFHCDQRPSFHAESAGMAQARTFRHFAAHLG